MRDELAVRTALVIEDHGRVRDEEGDEHAERAAADEPERRQDHRRDPDERSLREHLAPQRGPAPIAVWSG
jgi:hypothetical protein